MSIKVIKAQLKDSSILSRMNRLLIRDEKHRNRMTLSQLEQRMRKWFRSGYRAYLFLSDGQVVGYCLYVKMKDYLYIRQFYVAKNFRRIGLGKYAFGWLQKNVWKKEPRLRLDVLVKNGRGIGFWKAVGFKDYCLAMELEKRSKR